VDVLSLGIQELDRGLGGGIPYPCLISIEGGHGVGKTVFTQQIVYSLLNNDMKVCVITTESTVKEYLSMMESIKLDAYSHYLSRKLHIYPLHVEGGRWSKFLSSFFLRVTANFLEMKKEEYDAIIIDSLSVLTVETPPSEFLTFITRLKNIVSDGKTLIVSFHPEFLSKESVMKLKASSDIYFTLQSDVIAGMNLKILKVIKLWGGGSGERKSSIALEVNPAIGLRVMPFGGVSV
jgi:flagellar protein FlaH